MPITHKIHYSFNLLRECFKKFVLFQAIFLINFDEAEHHESITFLVLIMIDQPFLNIMIVNSRKETKHTNIGH